jgi:hypothetical protein
MKFSKRSQLAAVLLVAGLCLAWWWGSGLRGRAQTLENDASGSQNEAPSPKGESPLIASFGRFRETPDRAEALDSLARLQAQLLALPRADAVAWVRAFLATGDDRPTGLSFVIGAQGMLAEWPTFRTFLLDQLVAIDPAAAAALGREILTRPTTADEWALSLRNIGKDASSVLDPETKRYLAAKTEELIAHPAWQAQPSIGYLNAFDVLVATDSTASTPVLSALIQRKDRKDLAHAGYLTLDRLVQRQPADLLARLRGDRALQQSRPEMVAQQFARADVREPAQREVLRAWLLDPTRTAAELRSFAGIYPNNNRFISQNLLTSESAQAGIDLAAHDRAAMALINEWLIDPVFQPVSPYLLSMLERLGGFVASANAGVATN